MVLEELVRLRVALVAAWSANSMPVKLVSSLVTTSRPANYGWRLPNRT